MGSSGAEFLELCSQRRKSALEDIDYKIADLGRPEGGSVDKSTPTIDWILGADNHLVGIAIYSDEALGFLNLLQQVIDAHGSGLHFVQVIGENPVKRVTAVSQRPVCDRGVFAAIGLTPCDRSTEIGRFRNIG